MVIGILELYQGKSGKRGFYNSQEIGLSRALSSIGYSVVVFYPNSEIRIPEEETADQGIKIVSCPAKKIGVHSWYDWNVLKKYKVDVVQIGGDNQIFAPNIIRFCKENGIIPYCYIGTLNSDTSKGIKKILMDALAKRNLLTYKRTKCFAKTKSVLKELRDYGVEDVELAPVGLDTEIIPEITETKDELKRELNIPLDMRIVLFVGRMDDYKKPLEMLDVIKRDKKLFAIMIGTGSLDKTLDEIIEREGLSDRLIRIKQIENKEIHKFYKVADYFLNFNPKEIFGMSIMEAMYQGCTVIARHAPGPDTIIENGVDGYLTDDLEEMFEIIQSGVKVDRSAAHNKIVSNFTWDSTARKMMESI